MQASRTRTSRRADRDTRAAALPCVGNQTADARNDARPLLLIRIALSQQIVRQALHLFRRRWWRILELDGTRHEATRHPHQIGERPRVADHTTVAALQSLQIAGS